MVIWDLEITARTSAVGGVLKLAISQYYDMNAVKRLHFGHCSN